MKERSSDGNRASPTEHRASPEELRKQFLMAFPRSFKQPTMTEIVEKHPVVGRYAAFCADLLVRFPGRDMVFFERDALPLMWILEVLRGDASHPTLHSIYLNTRMMPVGLAKSIPDEDSTSRKRMYALRRNVIRSYLTDKSHDGEKAVRYVRQELANVRNGSVLVDAGYWGTMPLFAQAALPEKKFKIALAVGPPGSQAFLTDSVGPQNLANRGENFFEFTYEAEELIEVDGGLLKPHRITKYPHKDYRFQEQKAALLELAAALRLSGATEPGVRRAPATGGSSTKKGRPRARQRNRK